MGEGEMDYILPKRFSSASSISWLIEGLSAE